MYKLTAGNVVLDLSFGDGKSRFVPIDSDEYQEWLAQGNIPEPEFTQAELDAQVAEKAIADAKITRDAAMLTGAVYNLNGVDYQVSFTKDDGDGMVQVFLGFQMGLTNTTLHFANGTDMPVNSTDFPAFAQWFALQRNGFFA